MLAAAREGGRCAFVSIFHHYLDVSLRPPLWEERFLGCSSFLALFLFSFVSPTLELKTVVEACRAARIRSPSTGGNFFFTVGDR